ncbi:hypothetical protein TcasGA2_TC006852 [Tribolium castaneum]|uniref:Uncharacterized protein n=1 Tax=Tribolium castaneum TaxID=7070 RepID=D7EJ85_TRICA|nr:hypothetical protein TcasGA2_TC006852 [Tribolium castaneum]
MAPNIDGNLPELIRINEIRPGIGQIV